MRRTIIAAVGLLTAVGLAGCSAAAEPAEPEAFEMNAEILWSTSVDLVGSPVIAGDVVVSYLRDEDSLEIGAWSLEDGTELWRETAAPGGVEPGIEISASVVEASDGEYYTAFFTDDPTGWHKLRIAEASSGNFTDSASAFVWGSRRPAACHDTEFCFQGAIRGATTTVGDLRVDPLDGVLRDDETSALPENARALGSTVFATNDRPPATEMLGGFTEDGVLWQRPYVDVFGEGTSSSGGWAWSSGEDHDVWVGQGGIYDEAAVDAYARGETTRYDAGSIRTVGLDPESGETRWSLDRVADCPELGIGFGTVEDDGIWMLCRFNSGEIEGDPAADGIKWIDMDVDVIGIDTTSGEVVWEQPVDADAFDAETGFSASSEYAILPIDGVPTAVTTATGETEPVTDGVLACTTERADLEMPSTRNDGDLTAFSIGEDSIPCTAAGERADAFSIGAAEIAGVDAGGGVRIIAEPGALTAVSTGD